MREPCGCLICLMFGPTFYRFEPWSTSSFTRPRLSDEVEERMKQKANVAIDRQLVADLRVIAAAQQTTIGELVETAVTGLIVNGRWTELLNAVKQIEEDDEG